MGPQLQTFAADTANNDMFASLGIDWKMLIFQGVAFLIFVWIMAKWVMPPLLKVVDDRQKKIEEATKAAAEAEKKATESKDEVGALLKQARAEAIDIVETAKLEANAAVEAAEARASKRAETVLANAHDQIAKDVIAAKKALHNETLDLVALATEKVVGKTLTDKVDEKVITQAISEAQ